MRSFTFLSSAACHGEDGEDDDDEKGGRRWQFIGNEILNKAKIK